MEKTFLPMASLRMKVYIKQDPARFGTDIK